jgi:hypothetical protein
MATAMSPFMHARNTILLVVNNIEGICHCHYMPKILAGFMGSTCGKQACPIYLMSSLNPKTLNPKTLNLKP